jgi:hypothetical protein
MRWLVLALLLLAAGSLGAQDEPETEPEIEYTGPVTIARVRILIDGYGWVQSAPGGDFSPWALNPPEAKAPATRPETIQWLVGIAAGDRFEQAELAALAAKREKQLTDSNVFFNNAVTVLPVPSDPTLRTLVVDVKMGFSLRPSAGGAFASLSDLNIDGNLLQFGATLGFNVNAVTIGHGLAQAGPVWWTAGLAYTNNLLGSPSMAIHTIALSGTLGSAWLPLSPSISATAWCKLSPDGTPDAAWGVTATPRGILYDQWKSSDKLWGFGWSALVQCPVTLYAPDWRPIFQPELRLAAKPSLGPVELGVQASAAWSSMTVFDEYSLNLVTQDRGLRGGFAAISDIFVDHLAMANIELRLKAINFPFWIFESIGIWPYAYLDLALAGRNADPVPLSQQHLAGGGGLRLYLGIPVMLGFSFSYGWSATGIGAFTFAVSTGF